MKISQAILPVAGLGTRFLPLTKVVPKELLPLGNKLEAVLEKKGKLDAISELKKYDNVHFEVVYQHEQHGDGHALLQARHWIKDPVVAVLFGDDLITGAASGLQQLVNAYDSLNHDPANPAAILALENVPRENVSKYGIVKTEGKDGMAHRITGLVEKPKPEEAPSTLGIIGKYLVPKSVFDVLHEIEGGHGGEIRLIDALIHRLDHVPIYGVEMQGKRLDTGTPEGYKEAVRVLG